jgi:hypothetical protein
MKTKTIVTVLFVIIILISCAPIETAPPTLRFTPRPRSYNFAFVFQANPCFGGLTPPFFNTLDTNSSTLIHTPSGKTPIPFHLTDNELEEVYQKAMSINFLGYPPEVRVRGKTNISSSFRLKITNEAFTHSVTWTDSPLTEPNFTGSDPLSELINLIQQIIYSHPEYQQLPEPYIPCE